MVWVRSLVPKEKKSAASAIRCAVSAARGSSIIVPIGTCRSTPCLGDHLLDQLVGLVADQMQLHHRTDQRHHDLDLRVLAGLDLGDRRLGDGPDLQREQARGGQAEPDAAQAQHRVRFVQPLDRGEQLRVGLGSAVAVRLGERDLDRQFGAVGQELVQRRVEQPDVHRQTVHRVQQLGEVLPLQRQQRLQRRVPLVGGVGQDDPLDQRRGGRRGTCARCGTARCPARRACAPVRRPRRCRRWRGSPAAARRSACVSSRSTALTRAAVSSSAPSRAASRPSSM